MLYDVMSKGCECGHSVSTEVLPFMVEEKTFISLDSQNTHIFMNYYRLSESTRH